MATLEEMLGMSRQELDNIRLTTQSQTPAGLGGFQIGGTIQGSGNWDTNPTVQGLMGMQGQNLGSWQTEGNRRYIDTPFGRAYDQLYDYQSRGQGMVPGEGGYQPPQASGGFIPLGEYANEHGSDSIYGVIGADGTLQRVGTDRNSNRDMNTMLALIAGAGVGSALYGGAAAGAGGVGTAGMSAGELAAMDAAGGAMAGTGLPAVAGGAAAAGGAGTLGNLLSGAGSALTSPAGLNTIAQLLSGAYGAHQANRAAEIQAAAARDAIAEQRRQYDQSRADMMPWMEAGRGALGQLQGRLPELTERFTGADLQNDPGYQFELQRGQDAINAAARATGISASGATLKELLGFGQGLASTKFNEAFNRHQAENSSIYNMLAGISGTGQVTAGQVAGLGANAAGSIGSLMGQGANAQAAGRIGGANSWLNAIGNAWNGWQQQNTLNRLLGSNVVGG